MYSPMTFTDWGEGVWVDGRPAPGPKDDNYASFDRVTPGYFEVIGNPILRGRDISEQDIQSSRHVAVVNEALRVSFSRMKIRLENTLARMVSALSANLKS
ncbi:MAG TPA: hypothetical protein VHZ55_15480 [Bryobacteraceae bacterium]|nr:hypothetical protein [Bryobacteraceae bacterium]